MASYRASVKRAIDRWRRSPMRYERQLNRGNGEEEREKEEKEEIRVVVGKERRVFSVKRRALSEVKMLADLVKKEGRFIGSRLLVLESCDSMLFDHILWLASNGGNDNGNSSPDLNDLLDFYAQDL